jgi:hypothetical protein
LLLFCVVIQTFLDEVCQIFIFTDFTNSEHQLYDMYASLHIIGMITDDMGLVCGTHGKKRNAHGILVGKPEGERPLGRRRVDESHHYHHHHVRKGGLGVLPVP